MKLEELLNKLIEKGWKPFGINYYCYFNIRERIEIIGGPFGGGEYILEKTPSLRELVSKESGLWQFVCENNLVDGGVMPYTVIKEVVSDKSVGDKEFLDKNYVLKYCLKFTYVNKENTGKIVD